MVPSNIRRLTAGLSVAWFAASMAAAQVVTKLPDEIDVLRYRGLAADARKNADVVRAEANGLKTRSDALAAEAAGLRQQRKDLVQSLQSKQATLARQEAENPQLVEANRVLTADIAVSRAELGANARALDPITQSLRMLSAERAREQAVLDSLNQRVSQFDLDLKRANGDIADRERSLLQGQLNLQQAIERRNQSALEYSRVTGEIEAVRQTMAQRQRELRQEEVEAPVLAQRAAAAESAHRQKEQQVVPLRQRAAEARQPVEEARRQLQPIQKQVSDLQAELKKLDDGLAGLRTRLASIDRDIESTQAREKEARETIAASEKRLQVLVDAAGPDMGKARIEARIKSNEEAIALLRTESNPAPIQARVKALRDEIADLKLRLSSNSATPEIAALRKKIAELKTSADQLTVTLTARQSERMGVSQDLDRRAAQRPTLQADLDRALPRQAEAQRRLTEAEARIAPIQRDLDRENVLLDQLGRDLARDRRSVEVNAQQRRELAARFDELNRRRGQIEVRAAQLSAEVQSVDVQLPALDSWIAGTLSRISTERAQALSVASARGAAAASALTQTQTVGALQREYAAVDGRAQALGARNRDLTAWVAEDEAQIRGNLLTIADNTAENAALQKEIPQVGTSISTIDLRIPLADNAATAALDRFRSADAAAVRVEQGAAASDVRYRDALKGYNERLESARQSGERSGAILGQGAGGPKGTSDGQAASIRSGTASGQEEGLTAGFDRGRDDGRRKGDDAGFVRGNSAENMEAGRQVGLAQGERAAWDEARRVDNPRGRASRRSELLAVLPAAKVEIDNTSQRSAVLELPERASGPAPLSVPEDRSDEPLAIVAVKVQDVERGGIDRSARPIARPVVRPSVTVPVPVVPESDVTDCKSGHVDFIAACQEGFRRAFRSSYDAAYAGAFLSVYDAGFEQARRSAYDANLNVRYQEGFDSAYPAVYAAAERRGADEARAKGAAEGRREAFDRTIEKAREVEFQHGREEESTFFAENPVLRVERAALVEIAPAGEAGDLVSGDTFALELTLTNFGGVPAAPGSARVQWKALTSAAAIPEDEVGLAAIPAGSTAVVRRALVGQVARNVAAGSTVETQVVVMLPDGAAHQAVLSAPVAADLPIAIERISTETNPKLGKSYDAKVRLKNTGKQSTFDDLRVVVSSESPAVRIEKGEARLKKLKAGDTTEGQLQFKVVSPTPSGDQVVLKITVFHGRNVSARTTVILVPAR